ncbi:hypothetical protein GVN21_16850 [Caulobacter sp. SLTY]|nr:hypothetical protein [Caulobacter sp. SLTY]NBB17037.1 hypothetical protein [Caulobacter sp. SLTY]
MKLLRRLASLANPDTDRGNGPLQRCQTCRRARRDVVADTCTPCSLRTW